VTAHDVGVAVLHMCKKPVNSLNLDMITQFTAALDTLEANRQCNALIITSVCLFVLLLLVLCMII